MNLLFLGPVCPPERIEYIKQVSRYFDYPANVLELALIDGFKTYCNVTVISTLKMITKKFYLPLMKFKNQGKGSFDGVILSHFNIPFCEQIFNPRRKYRKFNSLGIKPDIIYVYSTRLDDIKAACLLKNKYPNAKVINMITDLPQFMRDGGSLSYKLLKGFETKLVHKYMSKYVDGYVLLSEYMKEYLPTSIPHVLIEGIFHPEDIDKIVKNDKERIVLYTGNLDARYGIKDLIDAFLLTVNQDYRLWLCGVGDTVEYINKVSLSDSRIKYLGVLPRKDIIKLQKQATLLVNPRHSIEEYTKFSFPSKTMEYMASGTPTLMSPLLSLPEDYKKHLYFFYDESVEGMARTLNTICEKDSNELMKFGLDAQTFILSNKTAEIQCKKILDFVSRI